MIAHSEKEQAAPTWKKTFGHHPMTAWADHGETGNGEPLALVLRAGNAGSNTAADHIEAARLAIGQLPRHLRCTVLVRADSGGGTHEFLTWLTARSRRLHYSVGMTITDAIAGAIGQVRQGAWVADITGLLDLDGWPAGMRPLLADDDPHPAGPAVQVQQPGDVRDPCSRADLPVPVIGWRPPRSREPARWRPGCPR